MMDWRELTVNADAPLIEALGVIDRGALQFALVVENERLVGLATDGDVRRALVKGLPVSSPVRLAMNASPVVGSAVEPRTSMQPWSSSSAAAQCVALTILTGRIASTNQTGWRLLLSFPQAPLPDVRICRGLSINGAVFVARIPWLTEHRTFLSSDTVGMEMPAGRSIDIDTIEDLQAAEQLLRQQVPFGRSP